MWYGMSVKLEDNFVKLVISFYPPAVPSNLLKARSAKAELNGKAEEDWQ